MFVILSTPPRCVCVCDFCRDESRRKSYVNRTVLRSRKRKKSSENAVLEKGREQMFGMTTADLRYPQRRFSAGERFLPPVVYYYFLFFFLLFSYAVLKNERDPCQTLVRVCFCARHRQSPNPQTGPTTQAQTMFFFFKTLANTLERRSTVFTINRPIISVN